MSGINNLPPSEEMFSELSGSFLNYAFNGLMSEKDDKSKKIAMLLAIVIFAYAGVEAVKLIFRNNFGAKGLDIWRLVLSFGAFIGIGLIAFNDYSTYGEYEYLADYGSKNSFLITTILYSVLALYILVKGIIEVRKRSTNSVLSSYRGDSTILSFLKDSGWSQSKIQNFAEPLLVLAIGIFLSPINFLLGLPLVFCAISVWIHFGYEWIRGLVNKRDNLSDNMGFPEQQERRFSQAIN